MAGAGAFAIARVKKIAQEDDDIPRISQAALAAIARSAELAVAELVQKTQAQSKKRRKGKQPKVFGVRTAALSPPPTKL